MSLTSSDLNEIRNIVESVVSNVVESVVSRQLDERLRPLQGEIEALRNDVKEIYGMIAELQSKIEPDSTFQKMTIEQKLLKLNTELLAAAKQAGISLPR
ncbi:MAG TPA: hypothetical protein VJ841_02200 [Candidatus Saccharimonadales bacterium]|nr:hypothetical protein [Candidatus Saccharimonadales bacterium]